MLTDDDLTRQLEAAFRDATADLTYTGRVPTPRRPAYLLLAPAVATVATAAALVVAATGAPGGDAPAPQATPGHRGIPGAGPSASGAIATERIEVAGFTLEYRRAAGAPDPIRVVQDTSLPDGARRVPVDGSAQAWVGTDPSSGDAAVWVRSPIRNGGRLFAIESSVWTQDQLVDLLHGGSPS